LLDTDKFYKVLKKYFPEDSFEHLQKPFYLTATDIIHAKSRVFSEGPLIRAILASAAFPVVLSPVEIDGVLYSDGGIVNNFPLEPIEEQCDHLIGIYVNPIEVVSPDEISNSMDVIERAYQIGVASMSLQKFDRFDLVICPENLRNYSTFSTNHVDEIYELGYQEAQKKLQNFSIKSSS
jgi:NTE family protein